MQKIIVMKKLNLALLLSFFLLGFWISSYFFERTNFISNGILAFTGIIVAWYTYEASLMKNEMVIQRRLSLNPSVIIEEKNKKFILSNYGTPAINIEISGVELAKYDEIVFPKILFLSPNSNLEIIGKTKSGSSLIDKKLDVYWNGLYCSEFEIKTSIKYSDLTGRRYETLMKVGKGNHKIIHIKELSNA